MFYIPHPRPSLHSAPETLSGTDTTKSFAHETADTWGILRRQALKEMLSKSADDLFRQLSYSKANRMHTNSGADAADGLNFPVFCLIPDP